MRQGFETFGWGCIAYGLMLIGLTALSALVRSDDAHADAFFWLYTIAFAMIYVGFFILKRIGAWLPPDANRS